MFLGKVYLTFRFTLYISPLYIMEVLEPELILSLKDNNYVGCYLNLSVINF